MTASWLTWQITWRSALRILGLGALFGGIYGASVLSVLLLIDVGKESVRSFLETPMQLLNFLLFAAAVGGFIGAILGFMVGILIGLLISAITIHAFKPLRDVPRYLHIVQWWSVLLGAIGTLLGTPLVMLVIFGELALTQEIGILAIFSIIPALLAGLAIRRGSGQVAMWYVRTSAASAPIPDRKMPLSS